MCFVAVREGLSEDVSLWLRTEEHRKDRHEKSEKKGIHTMGIAYKDQHTKKGAVAERSACPEACASQAQLPPVSTASTPTLPPPTQALLSRQLQTNRPDLGPRDYDWSWEDRAAQEPWTL